MKNIPNINWSKLFRGGKSNTIAPLFLDELNVQDSAIKPNVLEPGQIFDNVAITEAVEPKNDGSKDKEPSGISLKDNLDIEDVGIPESKDILLSGQKQFLAEPTKKTFLKSHKFNKKGKLNIRQNLFRTPIVTLFVLAVVASGIFLLKPQKTVFSYSASNCYKGIFLFPNNQKFTNNNTFGVSLNKPLGVFGKNIAASEYCIKPNGAPKENIKTKIAASLFGLKFLSKSLEIETPKYPSLDTDLTTLKAIPVAEPINFKLASPDAVFGFTLSANGKTVSCQKDQNINLICNPKSLELKHATEYTFALERTYAEKPVQTISSEKIVTITPIVIKESSVANNSIRYDKPKSITLTTDKPVQSVGEVSLISIKDSKKIPVKSKFENSTVTIEFSEELPRGQEYKIAIENIYATDGGSLINPYELKFSTSNGPKVTGVSIGSNGETLDKSIVIRFDQDLDATQDAAKHVNLNGGGKSIAAKMTISGSSITLRANEGLLPCTQFTITTDANLASPYGIKDASAWSYASRTECFSSFSIGTSVGGRAIMAYRYGSGGNAVLFVGGVHGNEQNATKLMYKWINEINANPQKTPANRTIVVIPSVNPDGYAKNQRVNAHGIDLNRNFAANNWKSAIKEPSGAVLQEGGGPTAQSEPETAALSSYVQNLRPLMVMSYHSYGGLAIANDAGSSRSLAKSYGANGGYTYKNGDTIGNTFNYDTTGAFEDWLYDKMGTPAILVELRTQYNDEFSSNVGPMWAIIQSANY